MHSFAMQRLDFRMPPFTRCVWVSDAARALWQPRIERIAACWHELEWRSVAAGLRAVTMAVVDAAALPELTRQMYQHGLMALPLDTMRDTAPRGERPALRYRAVIGAADNINAFRAAFHDADEHPMRALLGYPDCCASFFVDVWRNQQFIDTTWPMACHSTNRVEVDARTCEVDGPPEANILLRSIGVRAVAHLPCRFDCAATVERAEQMLTLGRIAGYSKEMDWLIELLRWPMTWSALHGIAEIKTPVLKIATASDATAALYTVRWPGQSYPEVGAHGLGAPYRQPIHLRLTGSRSFQRGLADVGTAPLMPQALATGSTAEKSAEEAE